MYRADTALGQRMAELGLRKFEVAGAAKINDRTLTEYLAGRQKIPMANAVRLAEVLECSVDDIAG